MENYSLISVAERRCSVVCAQAQVSESKARTKSQYPLKINSVATVSLSDQQNHIISQSVSWPARIPLVTPGMPWISVTLLSIKYLSQVALRRDESQNMLQSWVVTVPLAVSMVLEQTSNVFHTRVRFPRRHTLETRKEEKNINSITNELFSANGHGRRCLREHWRIDGGLDDTSVDGQDGENDTGQKNQGQLVDIFDADKHHRGHRGQQDGPVHAHVVQQGGLRLGPLQALQRKDCCFGQYVDLKQRRYRILFVCAAELLLIKVWAPVSLQLEGI